MPTDAVDDPQTISQIAARHGFSVGAAKHMLAAVARGRGGMAQFDHPEFGGPGQWMRGGMTMIGRMFDDALKYRVAALCADLAHLRERDPVLAGSEPAHTDGRRTGAPETGEWWPAGLGQPDSAGAQNDMRYAYFAGPHRLAVQSNGRITVYDTLDHRIFGVSQQQSAGSTLRFTSQLGPVAVESLPAVEGDAVTSAPARPGGSRPP
jgi:hypothetical protein